MYSYNSLRWTEYKNRQTGSETMDLSEDFASSYVSFGLNNIVARETQVQVGIFISIDTAKKKKKKLNLTLPASAYICRLAVTGRQSNTTAIQTL